MERGKVEQSNNTKHNTIHDYDERVERRFSIGMAVDKRTTVVCGYSDTLSDGKSVTKTDCHSIRIFSVKEGF